MFYFFVAMLFLMAILAVAAFLTDHIFDGDIDGAFDGDIFDDGTEF